MQAQIISYGLVLSSVMDDDINKDFLTCSNSTSLVMNESTYSGRPNVKEDSQDSSSLRSQTNAKQSNIIDTADEASRKRREIYKFQADWLVSTIAWSNRPGEAFELAFGSFIEDYLNKVAVVRLERDAPSQEIREVVTFDHPYPPTKILWMPHTAEHNYGQLDLLATTADYLRIWRLVDADRASDLDQPESSFTKKEIRLESLLNTNNGESFCAPLTSFDWNRFDPRMIVTSSVDTTCAIWDIETGQLMDLANHNNQRLSARLRSQVLAHNHEVYDVSFLPNSRDIFVSAGGDGSVRLFDLRKLDTSTILYEVNNFSEGPRIRALVRVSCNKQDSNYISTFRIDSNDIILLDLRNPCIPAAILGCHTSNVNSVSWAPHSAHHICSASDDRQALIWQLSKLPYPIEEPLLAYKANGHINSIDWSASHSDWIAIGYGSSLELLRV